MHKNAEQNPIPNMSNNPMVEERLQTLKKIAALKDAHSSSLEKLAEVGEEVTLNQGQTLLRAGVIETHAFLLLQGSLRLLGKDPGRKDLFTVGRVEPGELVGIVDLLRQEPCEAAIARQPCKLLSFPLSEILKLYRSDPGVKRNLDQIVSPCEGCTVLSKVLEKMNPPPKDEKKWLLNQLKGSKTNNSDNRSLLLSSVISQEENLVGSQITEEESERLEEKSDLPLRYWHWNKCSDESNENNNDNETKVRPGEGSNTAKNWVPEEGLDLAAVGLKVATSQSDLQGFKPIKGVGPVAANLATLRMIARAYSTPCPVDVLEKILEGAVERAESVPIQAIGQLAESMGLQTQVGSVKLSLHQLELPVVISRGKHYALITKVTKGKVLLADPESGWEELEFDEAKVQWGEEVQVVLLKRLADTPQRQFGWGWFSPVLKRFRWPLIQVLMASLFIQLFQLANPLLLQQIIDKVINQSNLTALQVLGAALVAAALFQGLLTAVRTWLLIDTTDRMDLVLGSQVIDKLLRLPLRFFEKRPVGELSQRLSELGNLRGFLTGTAITSALDLLFATIYIIIMLMYSPILTAVALATVPIYVLMILFIAPIYRKLIRRQAQYSARTQSHLIETLGGIQTVKAQHFELNSRWRWQERYSGQISEGFKSVVLGSSAGEIGNFLNQLSSLLIIWVGVYQVVNKNSVSGSQYLPYNRDM